MKAGDKVICIKTHQGYSTRFTVIEGDTYTVAETGSGIADFEIRIVEGGVWYHKPYEYFRKVKFSNALTQELAYKQKYEDDQLAKEQKRELKPVFTTDAEF